MAFVIPCQNVSQAQLIMKHLVAKLASHHKFTVNYPGIEVRKKGTKYRVEIRNIRLRYKRPYFGNRPNPTTYSRMRNTTTLNCQDWVEWNDWLNDQLDCLGYHGTVSSAYVRIRYKGYRRYVYDVLTALNMVEAKGRLPYDFYNGITSSNVKSKLTR